MRRNDIDVVSSRQTESILSTNSVLRNTYLLLSLTFLFSAGTAYFSWVTQVGPINPLLLIVGMYGLMFLTQALRNSVWGLLAIFAFTGFLGYTLGPILSYYTHAFSNGHQLIMMALGATGIIFFGLSGYALVSRKDFSYLAGFLFVVTMTAVLAMIAGFFFQMPALFLGISALFVLISSGMILFQTSQIIHGGETNYIMATITLYVSLYNLFLSLLQIFGAFNNKE
jgi:modulator of FtsH protease